MDCICCQEHCDGTFRMLGYAVCFNCAMNESYEGIMTVIRERLHVNINSWGVVEAAL